MELGKGLKARGNVEAWLGKVEAAMFASLKKLMKEAIVEYGANGRQAVLWNYPSQVTIIHRWSVDEMCVRESGCCYGDGKSYIMVSYIEVKESNIKMLKYRSK